MGVYYAYQLTTNELILGIDTWNQIIQDVVLKTRYSTTMLCTISWNAPLSWNAPISWNAHTDYLSIKHLLVNSEIYALVLGTTVLMSTNVAYATTSAHLFTYRSYLSQDATQTYLSPNANYKETESVKSYEH